MSQSLPASIGTVQSYAQFLNASGCFTKGVKSGQPHYASSLGGTSEIFTLDTSIGNDVYSENANVVPYSITVQFFIAY